jgi:FixJ family two-component response regulator
LDDGLTGIHILEGINQRSWPLPTLLLANQWTVPDVVQAMKAGADNFITLPYEIEELLLAVEQSLKQSQQKWEQFRVIAEFKARIAKLDKREREVINMVLCGHINKEIADHLDLALVTIKVYRSRAMKKLGAGNPAELARIAHLSGLCDDLSWPRRNS